MAKKVQGSQLYFIDPVGNVITEVACITTLDGLDAARDQIETTCLSDTARSYEPGLATPGAATFGINTDTSEASHVRLHELYVAGTAVNWALGWSDGTVPPTSVDTDGEFELPTTRSFITFNGYVSSFPFSFAQNTVVASSLSVQVSGFPVLVPKA